MKQISGYIDMPKTDFNKKQVVFQEGFAEKGGKLFKTVIEPRELEAFADVKISHLESDKPNWLN